MILTVGWGIKRLHRDKWRCLCTMKYATAFKSETGLQNILNINKTGDFIKTQEHFVYTRTHVWTLHSIQFFTLIQSLLKRYPRTCTLELQGIMFHMVFKVILLA